jgi:hypothetical protein
MNAFNSVNLAAACIITSVAKAQALGIPKDKWAYVLGGAGADDSDYCKLFRTAAFGPLLA